MAVDQAEELRLELRSMVSGSLYAFEKLVMGYRDMTPRLHGEMTACLQSPRQHKLIVEPRGHLKTSICTIGYATWRVCKNPNIRILLSNATATNSQHFLRNIAHVFESNALLQWLFPEVIPDFAKVKWTESEIEVARTQHYPEATIEAIGVGGTVVSRHYDLIIEDDLLAPEDGFVSNELVKKVIDWHIYASSLFVNPAKGEQVVVGTRWLYDDFIAYLMQHEKWFLPALYRGAYERDGVTPIWPERFTVETLDRLLEQYQPRRFSCAYLNDPVHEDSRSFDPAWIRYYDRLPTDDHGVPVPLACVTAIDPAISQKRDGDYSAIVTVASTIDRSRYVVDARRGRWGVDELIDQVFEVYRTWRPRRVGLETVMFQKALMWPFKEAMRRENVNLPIQELKPSSKVTKDGRIQSLHEYFANGSMWLNRGHVELLEELRGWPAVTHDDMLDALAYAIQMLVSPDAAVVERTWSPFSWETITKELRLKAGVNAASPFLWHGHDEPVPVWGAARVPQTADEIAEWLHRSRQEGVA